MFNLNQNIDKFNQSLLSCTSLKLEDREELSSHLECEIGELVGNGLTEEEAFYISKQRLGDLEKIADEFSIINSGFLWQKRFFWLAAGYFLFSLIPYLVMFASALIQVLPDIELFKFQDWFMIFANDFYFPYPVYILIPVCVFLSLAFRLKRAYERNQCLNYVNTGNKWFAFAGISFVVVQFLNGVFSLNIVSQLTYKQMNNIFQSEWIFSFIWAIALFLGVFSVNVWQRRQEKGLQVSLG